MEYVLQLVGWSIFFIAIFLIIGCLGYCYFFDLSLIDGMYLSLVTLSSLSLEIKPLTNMQKIFVSLYSVLSIGLYLIFISCLVSYLILWHSHSQELKYNTNI